MKRLKSHNSEDSDEHIENFASVLKKEDKIVSSKLQVESISSEEEHSENSSNKNIEDKNSDRKYSDTNEEHIDSHSPYSKLPKNTEGNIELKQTNEIKSPPKEEHLTENFYYPSFMGCRSEIEFENMNRIEEGTYGVVFRARDLRTNEIVALKKLKMENEREGFPITSLREINCLLKSHHENVVHVREVVVGDNMDKIFIVMEYLEHDLKSLMELMKKPFSLEETKTLLIQLLRGVNHLHDNWIIHRDIKTSNLLLNHRGVLKIADFGLAREYGSPLKPYTPVVVTLWYRSPELLLGIKEYSYPIDMWSVGCVFAEFLAKKPLFPATSEIDQIQRIFQELGTPNDAIWSGPPCFTQLPFVKKIEFKAFPHNRLKSRFSTRLTDLGLKLLNSFLTYDPNLRITADAALNHEFFRESPLPVPPALFPTWPTKHEKDGSSKTRANISPKAPQGGGLYDDISQFDQFHTNRGEGFTMSAEGRGKLNGVSSFSLKF